MQNPLLLRAWVPMCHNPESGFEDLELFFKPWTAWLDIRQKSSRQHRPQIGRTVRGSHGTSLVLPVALYLGADATQMENRSDGKMHANKFAAGEWYSRLLGAIEGDRLGMSNGDTAEIVYTIAVWHPLFLSARQFGLVVGSLPTVGSRVK
jgi:hypothetical protein